MDCSPVRHRRWRFASPRSPAPRKSTTCSSIPGRFAELNLTGQELASTTRNTEARLVPGMREAGLCVVFLDSFVDQGLKRGMPHLPGELDAKISRRLGDHGQRLGTNTGGRSDGAEAQRDDERQRDEPRTADGEHRAYAEGAEHRARAEEGEHVRDVAQHVAGRTSVPAGDRPRAPAADAPPVPRAVRCWLRSARSSPIAHAREGASEEAIIPTP